MATAFFVLKVVKMSCMFAAESATIDRRIIRIRVVVASMGDMFVVTATLPRIPCNGTGYKCILIYQSDM